jgi:hypothetical protein
VKITTSALLLGWLKWNSLAKLSFGDKIELLNPHEHLMGACNVNGHFGKRMEVSLKVTHRNTHTLYDVLTILHVFT